MNYVFHPRQMRVLYQQEGVPFTAKLWYNTPERYHKERSIWTDSAK